jgi:thiamine biosynthesis protein ThiI
MDKHEIVSLTHKIGAFDVASRPEVDCCSLFAPSRPIIHANFEQAKTLFEQGDFTILIEEAINSAQAERILEKT